jgi:hypothetical protein
MDLCIRPTRWRCLAVVPQHANEAGWCNQMTAEPISLGMTFKQISGKPTCVDAGFGMLGGYSNTNTNVGYRPNPIWLVDFANVFAALYDWADDRK